MERAPDARTHLWPHYETRKEIFEVADGPDSGVGGYLRSAMTGAAQRYIDPWLASAPLEDLLCGRPPQDLDTAARRQHDDTILWQWLVDRFTQTYLHNWSLLSLEREYGMLRGRAEVVIGRKVLQERVLRLDRVAIALADASIDRGTSSKIRVLSALIEQAVELLEEGERTAAAALFEAARAFSPGDPVIRNNYAFCILLDRPEEARLLLEEALDSGVMNPEAPR